MVTRMYVKTIEPNADDVNKYNRAHAHTEATGQEGWTSETECRECLELGK